MGVRIYQEGSEMQEVHNNILLESHNYIIDISEFSDNEVKHWIERERLEKHLHYIPNNNFATLKLTNVVGNVNLFGKTVDVRSTKLYDGYEGNEQFKKLVEELNQIYSQLSYSYTGVSSIKREIDRESFNPSDLERFDYFYKFTFNFPFGYNLDSLMNQVLSSPNKKTISYNEEVHISNSKHVSKRYFQNIGKTQHFSEIAEGHSLFDSPLVNRIRKHLTKSLLPMDVLDVKKKESYDTAENKFIKFFLNEIKSICLRLTQSNNDNVFQKKIEELKNVVDSFLFQPFFKEIGRLYYMPDSSSVLLNKVGYREIYYHFVQSQFGFTSIVDELINTSMKSGLKDIATLYEIWTFFELGKRVFKDKEIAQQFSNRGFKNGDIIQGISWSNTDVELKYNYSYSRRNNSSYSLSLRPDISLKVGSTLYLFDAKYKFSSVRNREENEEILRIVKSEDIYKMHAYLDAIEGAVLSVALYPGNTFVFYNRQDKTIAKSVSETNFEGVGAIPLSPNLNTTILDEFISCILIK